jgi:uncharacterized protein YacL
MNHHKTDSNDWTAAITRTTVRLGYWTAAWLLTMAVATFGPIFIWQSSKLVSLIAILVNLAIGFGMIAAHKRHLKALDEMHQKIQLEAMGFSLGIGLVVGLAYSNLDLANVIASDAEIASLVLLMGLTYMVGVIAGYRRYR